MPYALQRSKRSRFPLSGMAGVCEHAVMVSTLALSQLRHACSIPTALALSVVTFTPTAFAAPCAPPPQGEGHVAEIIDGRSFRLSDGREIRLAGIEPSGATKEERTTALSAILANRDVSLGGNDDAPDRYGRQTAFVYLPPSETPVQEQLVAAGAALVLPDVEDKDCATALLSAESEARRAQRGTWAENSVIKNAESPDDILAGVGHFVVVEGKVLSVRQAGATTYLNFGRNWTRDFAATIPRRALPAFATAGLALKSLENRRVRIRGWVEARPGPRIDVIRVGQIEVLGGS
jgi:endonuclease YncB( thermonuclease family)